MLTHDHLERERYEARLRLQRDHSSSLRDAHDKGVEEGIERGRQEGLVRQIRLCQQALKRPLTSREELLAQSLEHLEHLARELEQQLLPTAP